MTTCKGCRWLAMTWAKSRRSYARLVARGLSAEGAKSKSPLCHHCAGEMIRQINPRPGARPRSSSRWRAR